MYVYQDEVSPTEKKLKNFDFNWSGKSVLELGANVGKLGIYVLDKGAKKYKGIELDENMVKLGIERYGLDLICLDASEWKDYDYDVVIAMALFHHFTNEKLEALLSKVNSNELIFEVPIGISNAGLYYERTKESYTEVVEKCYGEVMKIVKSGATNDPYNERVIFYCKK